MERVELNSELSFSRVVLGLWRLQSWDMDALALTNYLEKVILAGVTTVDLADIYGVGECERLFGEAMKLRPDLRGKLEIVTKCNIVPGWTLTDRGLLKSHYDSSFDYIVNHAKASLERMQCEYIDVLLLHRLDYLMDAKEVARAFDYLKSEGIVKHFGVSNFLVPQLSLLKKYYPELVTNQIEISAIELEHFHNGVAEYLQEIEMRPMAWSPLAGGRIFTDKENPQVARVVESLERVRKEVGASSIDEVAYAFLYKHPMGIMPIVGSGKFERLEVAIKSLNIKLTNQQWYDIFVNSREVLLP